jgi:hypothetical protein
MTRIKRVKQHDLGDALTVKLTYRNTDLVLSDQITTMTPCVFLMRPQGDDTPVIDRATATVLTSTAGVVTVRYAWHAGDLDDVGVYDAEFEFTLSGGPVTAPSHGYLIVVVEDDVDEP